MDEGRHGSGAQQQRRTELGRHVLAHRRPPATTGHVATVHLLVRLPDAPLREPLSVTEEAIRDRAQLGELGAPHLCEQGVLLTTRVPPRPARSPRRHLASACCPREAGAAAWTRACG
eukprot:scaffold104196_cov42-Phaeocystis_antarctica.AAC.1